MKPGNVVPMLLLITLLAIPALPIKPSHAQQIVIFEDSFEDGNADGWTLISAGNDAFTWEVSNTVPNWAGNWQPDGEYFMLMDDDKYTNNENAGTDYAISPLIDCFGHSNIHLLVSIDFQSFSGDDRFWIEVSNDGGFTWYEVYSTRADTIEDLDIDISDIADNHEAVRIRFGYNDGNTWAWGAMFDDVKVVSMGGQPPVADFTWTPPNPVAGQPVQFDASSSQDPDGTIVQYQWDFGDGSQMQSDQPVVQHVYGNPGTYEVELTVVDDDGLSDTIIKQVTVQQPANPTFFIFGTKWPETLEGFSVQDGIVYASGRVGRDAYLVAFDQNGLLFSERFGGRRPDVPADVEAIGSSVYVSGYTASFGRGYKAFLAKFSQDGQPQWLLTMGGRRTSVVYDFEKMPALQEGALYAVGQWDGTRRGTRGMAFLASIDEATGHVNWIKGIYTRRGDAAKALWLGEGIYVAGTTYSRGRGDAFVASFDYDGNLQGYATFGGRRTETVKGMVYWNGYLYIVGDTKSFGRDKVFVAKFDPADMQVERFTIIELGRREYSFGIAQGSLWIFGSGNRGRMGFIIQMDENLNVVDAKALLGPRRISVKAMEISDMLVLAGETSIGEGRMDGFVASMQSGFEGSYVWEEGWHVDVVGIEVPQMFPNIQAIPGNPRVVDLQGWVVHEFNVWPWPVAVHQGFIFD